MEIKPCPKCGRILPIIDRFGKKFWLWCPHCCHNSTPKRDIESAIDEWNTEKERTVKSDGV